MKRRFHPQTFSWQSERGAAQRTFNPDEKYKIAIWTITKNVGLRVRIGQSSAIERIRRISEPTSRSDAVIGAVAAF